MDKEEWEEMFVPWKESSERGTWGNYKWTCMNGGVKEDGEGGEDFVLVAFWKGKLVSLNLICLYI